jgi:hypothetical protein
VPGIGSSWQLLRIHADELVPAVMHLTIEEAWWPVFDEFYEVYVTLCR